MLLPDPDSSSKTSKTSFEQRVPFELGSEEPLELPATIEGTLPTWLKGALIRCCPAVFRTDSWRAEHWFDGLGMLYAFRVAAEGVGYQQRLLESKAAASYRSGNYKPTGFGSKMTRPFLRRIFEPIPEITDNANVNVIGLPARDGSGTELLAMTESTNQLAVDANTLKVKSAVAYGDALGDLVMTAHPHWDPARDTVVNVASVYGPKPSIVVYEHGMRERSRKRIGEWRSSRLPYVHSFALTTKSAVLIGHPLTVNPLSLLWSNRPFIDHFRWRASEGMKLVIVDRATGALREAETESLFVFHVIHAFDDGDDTVVDVAGYDDPSVVDAMKIDAIVAKRPTLAPKPHRLRISKTGKVTRELLGDVGFEFPTVHYKRVSGKPQRIVWGTSIEADGDMWRSRLHRLDVETKTSSSFHEPNWVFGEPVFVAEPGGEREGQGVLLLVATHQTEKRSAMVTVDAETLDVLAWASVPTSIPLGFHGSFVR